MKRPWFRKLCRVTERFLAATGLMFIIYHTAFTLSVVTSPSMAPTLQGTGRENGDWVLTERISGWFRQPRRWEVVMFHTADGVQVMKRVIGFPGETVSLTNSLPRVNGQELPRPASLPFLKYYSYGNLSSGQSFVSTNGFYVLGDDSKDSDDSRYEGPIAPGRIEGRAWCIVWPPSRMGFISP